MPKHDQLQVGMGTRSWLEAKSLERMCVARCRRIQLVRCDIGYNSWIYSNRSHMRLWAQVSRSDRKWDVPSYFLPRTDDLFAAQIESLSTSISQNFSDCFSALSFDASSPLTVDSGCPLFLSVFTKKLEVIWHWTSKISMRQ